MRAIIILLPLALISCRGAWAEPNPNSDGDCAVVAEQFKVLMAGDPAVEHLNDWYAASLKRVSLGRAAALRTAIKANPGPYKFDWEARDDRAAKDPRYSRPTRSGS